jgi:hypothetical protein
MRQVQGLISGSAFCDITQVQVQPGSGSSHMYVQDVRGLYKTHNKRKLTNAERNLSTTPWGWGGRVLLLLQSDDAVGSCS